MNSRVVIRQQVHDFIAALSPVPRRKLWAAIKGLPAGRGDMIQLEGSLAPFFRLRVGKIRVVFEEKSVAGERVLVGFFADYRATVYRTLSQLIANNLLGELLN
jgi:mRNA-degrading endonuclease RelE of RelBE toxin-antitoxin system